MFGWGYEVEPWSRFWSLTKILSLSLVQILIFGWNFEVMLNRDFEVMLNQDFEIEFDWDFEIGFDRDLWKNLWYELNPRVPCSTGAECESDFVFLSVS